MNHKNTILIIILAALVGFGAGYLIYNQTKEDPKVVQEIGSGNEDAVSQVEVSSNVEVISKQSPVTSPTIVEEGDELTRKRLPSQIRELLPEIENVPAKEITFDSGRDGFFISYVANENLYNSHNTVLGRVRSGSTEWSEVYVARGAHGAVIDISNDSYQVRIIEETVSDTTTKVSLIVIEL